MAECLPGTLDMNGLPITRVQLTAPPLSRIVEALLPELSNNFETVIVEAVPCPDLTQSPFNLAAEGLSGDETVIDVGSPSYLLPLVDRNKLYDMGDLKRVTGSDPMFAVGAGAGPWPHIGVNCEFVGNVQISCNHVNNSSHVYRVDRQTTEDQVHENLPRNETRFALLANFYTCNGFGGEVLRIVCESRKGPLDFVTSVRQALAKRFGTDPVGLGGVILIENGTVNVHVMRDFSKTPINTESELNKWLKFYNVTTPLVGLGYLVSSDPNLDLRPQHFHLFSQHGLGGHYHYDTEPATIKYTAYLNVAKTLIRVDQPEQAISFGKD
ncbi:Domain of unknown function DUF1907 [Cinara cedri]|uniref:DUF1907 domain-containing protein n=1 Tax=Cinara cedri TaxID=506608 RepID=A0A5E4MJ44_9HEMI|nr:Domain of unknown function DUF1907 [Cinara cedri]